MYYVYILFISNFQLQQIALGSLFSMRLQATLANASAQRNAHCSLSTTSLKLSSRIRLKVVQQNVKVRTCILYL